MGEGGGTRLEYFYLFAAEFYFKEPVVTNSDAVYGASFMSNSCYYYCNENSE